MGSEHYCLRWNNHQSNLLGVFSQLLQDESLVDVTLACSEGAPIRAHKVVLSACSSYFQSLFLDHPERHPIVILKDVRFSELQTLVEFMYKGEVNVQYCQLSALLKTAESLKVKGLAEMTNQNTALREPEREPDRLRPHSQPKPSAISCDNPLDTAAGTSTSGVNSATHSANAHHHNSSPSAIGGGSSATGCALASLKREPSDRCSPSPPKRLQQQSMSTSPVPLDLYQRRGDHDASSTSSSNGGGEIGGIGCIDGNASTLVSSSTTRTSSSIAITTAATSLSIPINNNNNTNVSITNANNNNNNNSKSNSSNNNNNNNHSGEEHQQLSQGQHHQQQLLHHHLTSPEHHLHHHQHTERNDRPPSTSLHVGHDDMDDDDEDEDEDDADIDNSSNDIGLNMSMNATTIAAAAAAAAVAAAASSTSASASSTSAAAATTAGAQSTVVVPSPGRSGTSASSSSISAISSAHQTAPTISSIPSDLSNRPASRSGHLSDRPGSVGIHTGASSSSLTHTATTTSRISSPIVTGIGDPVAGPSGLGPVQSVPLSLKKEIDWDRSEDSNRATSISGGDLDYRHSHDSETSQSPHGLKGGSDGGGASSSGCGNSGGVGGSGGTSLSLDQGQTPSPIYPCVYCGATFPHQSKLTRHILSHSLETLKYRETAAHLLHPSHMLSHELPPLPQHFSSAHHRHSGMLSGLEGLDPQDGSPMEIDFATAANMAVAAAANMSGGCLVGTSGLSISAACSRLSSLDDSSGRGSSSAGNGGIGGVGGGSSGLCGSSGLASSLSGAGSSSFATSVSASSSNDPNSVVLCKFCGKSFPDVASLITHLPVHTGDRPFKCEFCGKAFKLRHHMKDHCRVHTGERPFRCHMCGKTFSRSTILKAHEKTHFPKYVRKFLSPSPVDTKDELPQ